MTPSPVALGTGPTGSVNDTLGLLTLRVPLPGDGAAGAAAGSAAFAFTAVALFTVTFFVVGVAPKLSIASGMPAVHNRTATKLRKLMKPDLEEEFFFTEALSSLFYRALEIAMRGCAARNLFPKNENVLALTFPVVSLDSENWPFVDAFFLKN